MKILVTGGMGYIGSHTCVELLNLGMEVVIVDNLANSNPEVLNRVETITGKRPLFYELDVCDEAALSKVFAEHKIDCVIHFAGMKAVGESVAIPEKYYSRFLSRRAEYPSSYKMSESGIFLRETVLDIPQVEDWFVTPRSYNFYMSRKSSEEWEAEQKKDGNDISVINLSTIEKGVSMHSLEKMLIFENGKADYRKISDIELCTELDRMARSKYGVASVYQLSYAQKQVIAEDLYRRLNIGEAQIRRCLAFPK